MAPRLVPFDKPFGASRRIISFFDCGRQGDSAQDDKICVCTFKTAELNAPLR